ncbi:MAG: nitroreductase family deazaflavin-dependent oxidoreductase [Acidimicrobiia bacterium]|nr:nitroreductase family deazaflavin-dependent oxidoreductase [Acidimicrobiia bacterium]
MKDSSVKRWSAVHTAVFAATGGLVGRRLVDNDMLLLTTIGRASGRPHTVPLLYLAEDDRLVVIASYGGRDWHPDWFLNLEANPLVAARVPFRRRRQMVARTASPDERERWWPRIVRAYGGYAEYEAKTERQIPVVFLEPLPETTGGG